MLFSLPFQDIGIADVEGLLANGGYPESEHVEYKEFVPGREAPDVWHEDQSRIGEYGRDKILAEIVGFANSHGGHVVIGIKESEDKPKRAVGITPTKKCSDLADRLRQMAFANIEPRLTNLQIRGIKNGHDDDGVVIVRVPRSTAAPHRVMGKSSEFARHSFVRRGESTEAMTMTEIQDSVLNATRGLEAVNEALGRLHTDFAAQLGGSFLNSQSVSRTGIWCAAVPIQPLALTRQDVESAVQQARRQFVGHFRFSGPEEIAVPVSGYNTRPILRGSQIHKNSPWFTYEHSIRRDGSQCATIRMGAQREESRILRPAAIFDSSVQGLVASVLDRCAALAKQAENPGVEYAVDIAIHGEGTFITALNHTEERVENGKLYVRLPRYSYFLDSSPVSVLNEMIGDLLNDQGRHYHDELMRIE